MIAVGLEDRGVHGVAVVALVVEVVPVGDRAVEQDVARPRRGGRLLRQVRLAVCH